MSDNIAGTKQHNVMLGKEDLSVNVRLNKALSDIINKSVEPPENDTDRFKDESPKSKHIDRDTLHIDMLNFVLDSSRKLSIEIDKSEKSKTTWRNRFIWTLVIFFGLSLAFACVMTALYGFGKVDFPLEVVVGLFGTIIVQLVSLLVLFVKFVNDVQYIKMFKTVTHKLLEYLTRVHPSKNDDTPLDK